MKTVKKVKTIKEYQDCVDEVLRTKEEILIQKIDISDTEMKKANKELNLKGVDVLVGLEGNLIKIL